MPESYCRRMGYAPPDNFHIRAILTKGQDSSRGAIKRQMRLLMRPLQHSPSTIKLRGQVGSTSLPFSCHANGRQAESLGPSCERRCTAANRLQRPLSQDVAPPSGYGISEGGALTKLIKSVSLPISLPLPRSPFFLPPFSLFLVFSYSSPFF